MQPDETGHRRLYQTDPKDKLCKLIDFDRVANDSGFRNLFQNASINHYSGWSGGSVFIADPHNPYDGLRAIDILLYLNSTNDVVLSDGEEELTEWNRLGVIHRDGRIDLERESP